MTTNNIDEAKELFLKYGGLHYEMAREGEYELYKSFNITKEQEFLWIQEYEKKLFKGFENENNVGSNFFYLCSAISEYMDVNCLENLCKLVIEKAKITDSFSIMLMGEGLLSIAQSLSIRTVHKKKATWIKNFALELLNGILEKPITIAEYYKQPGYLIDPIDEQKLIARVKSSISWWG